MNSKLASLLCCLIMLVSFSGCTKVTQLVKDAQPTKAELLAEINEEHRRYEGGSSDPTPYLRHYDSFRMVHRSAAFSSRESLHQ